MADETDDSLTAHVAPHIIPTLNGTTQTLPFSRDLQVPGGGFTNRTWKVRLYNESSQVHELTYGATPIPVIRVTIDATHGLRQGRCQLHAQYLINNGPSDWGQSGFFTVILPVQITAPAQGSNVQRTVTISGTGAYPGATIKILVNGTVYGSGSATSSSWNVQASNLPIGTAIKIVATQTLNGVTTAVSPELVVNVLDDVREPVIESPKTGDVITVPKPTISGTGHSGATIRIYEAGSDAILYGSGNVSNGSWSIDLTEPLPNRRITLVAGQTFNNGTVKWSNEVPVDVRLKPGTLLIGNPPANTIVNRTFDISGTGGTAGADIKVMLDLEDLEVGTTQAQGDIWRASVTFPAKIQPGEVRLACEQKLNGIPSDRSPYRPFNLRPERITSLAATVDDDAKVTITGTGTVGATLYIHYVGDDAPLKTFTVPSNSWSMDYPDWLPGVAPYRIGARQSVAGSDGQPIYSDWADREGTFTVNVPLPTLTYRVSPDGNPTFSGTGRNWPGQPASTIEVRLNNTNDPIVPIVDVQPNRSWTSAAAARWAPGTYLVTARQSFKAVSSTWLQPTERVVISAPPAVIEKVTPDGLSAKVAGQCWPGAQLTITFSDNPASHTVADTDRNGQWDFQRSTAFRPGRHTVTVTQTFGGQTSSPVSMSFEIAMSVPVITPPPNGQTDHLPELQGTGGIEGGKIQVFDFVTLGLLGEATATGDVWSVKLLELDYREYTVFAIQSLDELKSQRSASVTFKVVLFAPRIDFPKNRTSVPRTFTVEGYARAGKDFDRTEVEVYLDGVPYRVYPHFGDGYFKQNFTRPLGPCVLKARQYFQDQESPFTQDVLVTIVPDKPIVETPAEGDAVGRIAMICGFGYPKDTVVVALPDGTELGEAEVQEDGTWFCQIVFPGTGTDLSLVTEQRKGEFRSGWSEPQRLQRLADPPTFDEPPEGKWEGATPQFAGDALAGSRVDVLPWYNAEEKHANALVTDGGRWAGASERNLPAGPQWARAVQVVGGQRSIPADSKRFEIAPSDEPPRRHPTPE
ncbi:MULTISPECIES: Ig-like domain-containing protein [unclassified Pseudomonas]|uniref:Ig-like domain-containing protein n=1 Tax=unclassified Pseudomonas TaxID=196821 RepID=UPI000A1F6484|nr:MULTISPECIES: Ig-like domain-containing protein [unclassified Pseudomonas]